MQSDENNRRVLKRFSCLGCKSLDSLLVHPSTFRLNCKKCGKLLNEISENDYKSKIQKGPNSHQTNFTEMNHQKQKQPIRPNINNPFDEISKNYQRPPSNNRQKRHIDQGNPLRNNVDELMFRANNNQYNRGGRAPRVRIISHVPDENQNFNRERNYHDNRNRYFNFNNINESNDDTRPPHNHIYNNFFEGDDNLNRNRRNLNSRLSNNNNDFDERFERRNRNDQQIGRRELRGRSINPVNHFFHNFFNGFQPVISDMVIHGPGEPVRFRIIRHNFDDDIFDPLFFHFGSNFDNHFQNNYASNFRSNMMNDGFNRLIELLVRNLAEGEQNRHPPTQKDALNKLKKFPMNEKFCKKDSKGKLEYPNCCICISEINKGENTVLLPCGHMFHWNCCLSWLEKNNTCPICRFELPGEKK